MLMMMVESAEMEMVAVVVGVLEEREVLRVQPRRDAPREIESRLLLLGEDGAEHLEDRNSLQIACRDGIEPGAWAGVGTGCQFD